MADQSDPTATITGAFASLVNQQMSLAQQMFGAFQPGLAAAGEDEAVGDMAQWAQNTINAVPLKRIGKAEDIANAAVFLASRRASYITGHQIPVAGGYGV